MVPVNVGRSPYPMVLIGLSLAAVLAVYLVAALLFP
jgi:hypothetical protein